MNATELFELDATETTATEAGKNDKRRSDLNKTIKKLGEDAGLGKDSLPKLAHAVVKAASDGIITGSDAEDIYKRYAQAESNKAIHEHSVGGMKANVSKLKQLIDMGCMTTIDGVELMQAAFDVRENLLGQEGVKLKASYPFYVDVARAQLKTDKMLGTYELEEIAVKPEASADKSVEKELTAILKRLEGLVSGENKHGLHDKDEDTEAAYHILKGRLDKFATLRAHDALRAQALALGVKLA